MSWQHGGRDLAVTVGGEPGTLASDADRDAAARVLSEAFAQGRLTADEHGQRVRAAYAARTWRELAGLTADLPGPADAAAGRAAEQLVPAGVDRCLLCALLVVCPPAGIAWLLAARRRARAGQRRALAPAGGPSSLGRGGAAVPAVGGWRAEDR